MTAPWFKYYPADWRSDPKLRMCSLGARGLWMEMLCLMHEAEPRGSLVVSNVIVNEQQLASLVGSSLKETSKLQLELETAGVFSRDPNGTIFSRRMRRDEEKAKKDKANGSAGGNPNITPGVNPKVGDGIKPRSQKLESREINNSFGTESAREFPTDGSILFSEPFCSIGRERGRGADVDILANRFRSFCFDNNIPLNDPQIGRKWGTFCGKHKVQGLHS